MFLVRVKYMVNHHDIKVVTYCVYRCKETETAQLLFYNGALMILRITKNYK